MIQKNQAKQIRDNLRVSVLPCTNKRPNLSWKDFQSRVMTDEEIGKHFPSEQVAIITGSISGNLEVIDIDDMDVFPTFYESIITYFDNDLSKIKVIKTGKGAHIYFRNEFDMSNPPEGIKTGSLKLASKKKNSKGITDVRIETRGEAAYVIAPPSPNYSVYGGGQFLTAIPMWSLVDRQAIFSIAREYNEHVVPNSQPRAPKVSTQRVSNTYKRSSWEDYNDSDGYINDLQSLGFTYKNSKGNRDYYLREGSTADQSGNFNRDMNRFSVFSSSTCLDPDKQGGYSPTQLRCMSLYGNLSTDAMKDTCKVLSDEGFGEKWTNEERKVIKQVSRAFSNDATASIESVMSYSSAVLTDYSTDSLDQMQLVAAAQDESKRSNRGQGGAGQGGAEQSGTESALGVVEGYIRAQGFVRNELTLRPETKDKKPLTDFEYTNTYLNILRDYPKTQKNLVIDVLESNRLPSYHPFREYFDNIDPMGGTTTILSLFESLNVECSSGEDLDMSYKLFIKWLTQFITSSYQDAPSELQLVLTGNQGGGKTFFFSNLLPKVLNKNYYKSIQDFPRNDSDAKELLSNNLFVLRDDIMGEGTSGSSNAGKNKDWIKSILSANMLTYRTPYARVAKSVPRYAVLAATTNDLAVLGTEETANRRILPLRVNRRDKEKFDAILENGIDDLWREVKYIYQSAEDKRKLVSTTEEEIEWLSSLDSMRAEDSAQDFLLDCYEVANDGFTSTKDIIQKAGFFGFKMKASEVNKKMLDLGFEQSRKSISVNIARKFLRGYKVNAKAAYLSFDDA